jgi:HK97 family phage major capsid protein
MTKAELQAKRTELANTIKQKRDAFHAGGKKWKDEAERQAWDQVNKDYNDVETKLDEARKLEEAADAVDKRWEKIEADLARSTNDKGIGLEDRDGASRGGRRSRRDRRQGRDLPNEDVRCLAFQGYCRREMGEQIHRRHAEAMRQCNLRGGKLRFGLYRTAGFRMLQRTFAGVHASRALDTAMDKEHRDLSPNTFGAGQALIPDTFIRSMEVNMLAFGGMLQVAEVITTAGGELMTWPTADDTSNEGEIIGVADSIGNSVDPAFKGVQWGAHKFSSKLVKVPSELLEDSAFDLPTILGAMLGERIGRKMNRECTVGTGANRPKGIVTAATLGVTAASATAITYDEIITLEHRIDPAYRNGAGYMMHDNVLLAIRLLKDTSGMYLWVNGTNANMRDTVNGYPNTINQHMASSIATTAKTVLFGQLSKYKIRRVAAARFYRLVERYRDQDQEGFVSFVRADGNLLDAGTAPVKFLQQA